jgi:methionine-S-sulfoxide reductase
MIRNTLQRWYILWLAGLIVASPMMAEASSMPAATHAKGLQIATFAGGCFWCMQPPFDNAEGVVSTRVGYTGGDVPNPTYAQVSSGTTGHLEAIEVTYDPKQISYEDLLTIFWHNIDPTQGDGQFVDRGPQYHTAIFYHDEAQHHAAEQSKSALAASGKFDSPIVTKILPAKPFYPAEDYHQHFSDKNPLRYEIYRSGSGRSRYIERTWGETPEH